MPNHLSGEKSPYLLQHAHHPVDWYPWGDAAFEKARRANKPIFLSIGYATCHWCHVMAHESFEDPDIADLLNQYFVAIKVDREERPDIDHLYMTACQALTGQGGWPLSVFMTPDAKPFYAGTYFPKRGRFGLPGFADMLRRIAELWRMEPEKLKAAGDQLVAALSSENKAAGFEGDLAEILERAVSQLGASYDSHWGGFGPAPKFPTPHRLTFLLRWFKRTGDPDALAMVEKTMKAMWRGGVYDQIGFGFHRYSVDAQWRVPHFEKMLYDQALIMMAAAECLQATGRAMYGDMIEEVYTYVAQEMRSPEGGFYSAQDADSEGKEGLYYLWRPEEVMDILGNEEGALVCRFFDITPEGNFEEGRSIPRAPVDIEAFGQREGIPPGELKERIGKAKIRLLEARRRRIPPLKDDKVLTSWNGLMIAALAQAACATGRNAYLAAAKDAADFLLQAMVRDDRLFHRFREGDVAIDGLLEDYVYLTWGLLELYEAGFETEVLSHAIAWTDRALARFWDEEGGGFFLAAPGRGLPVRSQAVYDGAVPSANSVALSNLLRLGYVTGNVSYHEHADRLIQRFIGTVASYPSGYTHFLNGVMLALGPSREIVVSGDPSRVEVREALSEIRRTYLPESVAVFRDPRVGKIVTLCPYLSDYPMEDSPAVYICEGGACREPVRDLTSLKRALASL